MKKSNKMYDCKKLEDTILWMSQLDSGSVRTSIMFIYSFGTSIKAGINLILQCIYLSLQRLHLKETDVEKKLELSTWIVSVQNVMLSLGQTFREARGELKTSEQ